MSDLAQLLLGISAVLGTLFTGVTGLIAIFRAPRKVAERASRMAIDRAISAGGDDEEDEELGEAAEELLRKLLDRRRDGGQ